MGILEKLFDNLLASLENGNWLIAIVIVAIAVIINLRGIVEFFERRSNRREEFIKDALKIDIIRDAARFYLEEELNYLVFKRVTGISADRALREKIKLLVDCSRGELQTFQFSRTRRYLKIINGKLLVQIKVADKIENLFNQLFAMLIAVLALLILMLPTTVKGATLQQVAIFISFGVLLFFFSLFIFAQTISMSIAKKIQPTVEILENRISIKSQDNHISFIELPAKDTEQLQNVQSFFCAVFGWSYKNWGDDYADTQNSGINSGINADPESRPNSPLAVIYTDDLEAMRDKIAAAGGTITKEIFSFPGGRRFHFKDPADNELAVWSDQV